MTDSQMKKELPPALIREAWRHLAQKGEVRTDSVRPEIAASWQRCLDLPINPRDDIHPPDMAPHTVMEENRLLLAAASAPLRELRTLLSGRGYVIMLYSADGYILSLTGDPAVVRLAEAGNVFPGASHSEAYIGTFAPGICLAERRPVQVQMHEHYREMYHDWCCTAVPVFDHAQQVQGILDVTSVGQRHPAQLLNLLQLTVRAIEAELSHRQLRRSRTTAHWRVSALLESSSEALVFVDGQDIVTHLNPGAQKLLGVKAAACVGRDAHTLISNYASVKQGLQAGRQLTELRFFSATPEAVVVDARLRRLEAALGRESASHADGAGEREEGSAEAAGFLGVLTQRQSGGAREHATRYGFQDFICRSEVMKAILEDARAIAATEHTVLIQGESGTGKEVLAQAMHQASPRRGGPFVAVNCAALSRELLQSELFGYEAGAFTGAHKTGRRGKFEHAQGGTLFLDEIGDMPLEAQANLLRVLQEKSVMRVGGTRVRPLDVRVMAATNQSLEDAVAQGRFRRDLFYRLSVISLRIPPLRERRDDIGMLLEHFLDKHADWRAATGPPHLEQDALAALLGHDWPGNVRELENAVIALLTRLRGGRARREDLPPALRAATRPAPVTAAAAATAARGQLPAGSAHAQPADLQTLERQAIAEALERCRGHLSNAARQLGINRVTLYRKMKRYAMDKNGT